VPQEREFGDPFLRRALRPRHGRRAQLAAAFGCYLGLSFLFFGVRVTGDPQRTHIGGLFTDPQIFVWAFTWWPDAISQGKNPFYTHAIWAPDGFNLAWATSVPALALAFAPLTIAFGPILSYDPERLHHERLSRVPSQGENILALPVAGHGDSMAWQAESGFWFRLSVAYISPTIPESFLGPGVQHLTTGDSPAEVTIDAVRELAQDKGITAIVVDDGRRADWEQMLAPLGPPTAVGGALIYRLDEALPGCRTGP
jgi:hypothetical protein